MKTFRRIAAGIALMALTAGAVHAHAVVVKSSPAAGALVAAGAIELDLTFNTRLDPARSRLALAAPDGRVTTVTLRGGNGPTRLGGRADVATAGAWKIRWQVLAADGHITRGEIPFRVRQR